MLQAMRKYARSFIAVLLFGILILTFAAWGIGDIFRGRGSDPVVAEFAGVSIHVRDVRAQFTRQLEQYQAQSGGSVSSEQAIKQGLHLIAAEQLVQQALRGKILVDMGVAVPDDLIRLRIANNPAFRDFSGKFDPRTFAAILQRAGLSEAMFVAEEKRDIGTAQLYGSMVGAIAVPAGARDLVYKLRNEKRVIETLALPYDAIKDVPIPSDDQLTRFYQANAKGFALPEFRKAKYILVRPDDVTNEIKIGDAKLREEYENRKAEFAKAETRQIAQVVFNDEAKAKQFAAAVKGGKDFAAAAKEVTGLDNAVIELGATSKADLPGALADAAFALALNAASDPVKTPLGWHVLRVSKIEPGSQQSFEQVRDQLLAAMKKQQAPDILAKMALDLEKAIGRGATLEEAAAKFGLTVRNTDTIDAAGRLQTGVPATGMPAMKKFLPAIFSQRKSEDGGVNEEEDGSFFVVKVDDIIAARIPELAEIKDKVILAWTIEEKRVRLAKQSEELVNKLNAGGALAGLARPYGVAPKTSAAVTRDGEDAANNLPKELTAKMFELKPGFAAFLDTPQGILIGRVKEIQQADPAKDKDGLDKLTKDMRQALQNEVLIEYEQAMRKRLGAAVDVKTLNEFFTTEQRQ